MGVPLHVAVGAPVEAGLNPTAQVAVQGAPTGEVVPQLKSLCGAEGLPTQPVVQISIA